MESRELRYFITVAEEGTFTRAASRLFMTQPALSRAVRQIERELGAALFVRTRNGVNLTVAGQVLLREGRTALDWLGRAASHARAAGEGAGHTPRPQQAPAGPTDGRATRPPLLEVRPRSPRLRL